MPRWRADSKLDPMSLAGLIAGRDLSQAIHAVLSDSDRVLKTLERAVRPDEYTDPMDIFLFGKRRPR